MVSDHDTDDAPGPPRETTDPSFPGPMKPAKKEGTNPGFPPPLVQSPAAGPAKPADDVPLVVDVVEEGARPASEPPGPKARTESIDELIDGLAGEGFLPKDPHAPKKAPKPKAIPSQGAAAASAAARGNETQSSAARKPSAPVPASAPLPAVLVRPDSQSEGDDSGDRRSDPTVLTPFVLRRRTRAATWIAGVIGVALALLLLAVVRQATRSDDPIAPATTQPARATIEPASAITPPVAPAATSMGEAVVPKSPGAGVDARSNAARRVEPSATPPVRSAPPTASSANELDDFRKKIRQ